MGATSPGRWQPWQRFWRTGRTSLVNVTCGVVVAANEAVATVRVLHKEGAVGRVRCWVSKRLGTWKVYDFENLDDGIRCSVLIGRAMKAGQLEDIRRVKTLVDASQALVRQDVEGVALGELVVLLGAQGDERITAEELATGSGTIPWEVLCGITKTARVPRIYRGTSAA